MTDGQTDSHVPPKINFVCIGVYNNRNKEVSSVEFETAYLTSVNPPPGHTEGKKRLASSQSLTKEFYADLQTLITVQMVKDKNQL